jgi:hypothetical protein
MTGEPVEEGVREENQGRRQIMDESLSHESPVGRKSGRFEVLR